MWWPFKKKEKKEHYIDWYGFPIFLDIDKENKASIKIKLPECQYKGSNSKKEDYIILDALIKFPLPNLSIESLSLVFRELEKVVLNGRFLKYLKIRKNRNLPFWRGEYLVLFNYPGLSNVSRDEIGSEIIITENDSIIWCPGFVPNYLKDLNIIE